MALRLRPGARPGRAALGRADAAGLAVALYAAVGAAVAWPALQEADSHFLALREPGFGEASPGDHLQLTYWLWLFGHRLGRAENPWVDPYSFQPAADGLAVFGGWLFGLPLWPVFAAAGPVAAWNVFVLGSSVLAGCFAAVWLRSLGLPRGAALAGGLVFAVFPYRVAQSTGHLLGPIAALLPLALWAVERRRFVVAAAALAAVPLSGQLHLALGAIPLLVGYGAARGRLPGSVAAALPAVAGGLVVARIAVEDSVVEDGRSLRAVAFFTPDWQDFLARELRHPPPIAPEFALFMGWLTPFLALAGLVLLVRSRRYALAAVLGLAALVPIWLALGTALPTYRYLWEYLPPFRYPRVPGRLMPIAGLAIGALVATLIARRSRPRLVAAALVVLFLDLRIGAYDAAPADPRNAAYATLRDAEPGRVLQLPALRPERHWGSVYLYYTLQAPRERIGGYSTTAPPEAAALLERVERLNCGGSATLGARLRASLDVRYVVVHEGLYRATPLVPAQCANVVGRALAADGWELVARDGPVALYRDPSPG